MTGVGYPGTMVSGYSARLRLFSGSRDPWGAIWRPTAGIWNRTCVAGGHFSAFSRSSSDQEKPH